MRQVLLVLFVLAVAVPASAEIRDFTSKLCPICVDNTLKSEVTVEEEVECTPTACIDKEYWDDTGKYIPATSCFDCTPKYFYKCTQGHTFETLTKPSKQ